MLDQLTIEDYKHINPNMDSAKSNGFKSVPKGDGYANPIADVKSCYQ